MRCLSFVFVFVCVSLLSVQVSFADKRDIILSLKKLQSAVEIGAPKSDYLLFLNESNYQINVLGEEEHIDKDFLLTANACHVAFRMLLNVMAMPVKDSPEGLTVQLLTLSQDKINQLNGML